MVSDLKSKTFIISQTKMQNKKPARNIYYQIGVIGLILNVLLYFISFFKVDPYFAGIFTAFFPVWIIILVVGYRKAHPRR